MNAEWEGEPEWEEEIRYRREKPWAGQVKDYKLGERFGKDHQRGTSQQILRRGEWEASSGKQAVVLKHTAE